MIRLISLLLLALALASPPTLAAELADRAIAPGEATTLAVTIGAGAPTIAALRVAAPEGLTITAYRVLARCRVGPLGPSCVEEAGAPNADAVSIPIGLDAGEAAQVRLTLVAAPDAPPGERAVAVTLVDQDGQIVSATAPIATIYSLHRFRVPLIMR